MNCPKCKSENTVMVEYGWDVSEHWDGWSELRCLDCKTRTGRFSGKELGEGELEKRDLRFSEDSKVASEANVLSKPIDIEE